MLVRGEDLARLTTELRERERLLERLFDRIIEERRDERLRIASGLHDDVLQSLIRISQVGSFLKNALPEQSTPGKDARELASLARETIDTLRDVLRDLQKSPVGRGGLVPSLRALVQDLQLDWRTKIRLNADANLLVAPDAQIVGYQAAREAIMNSLKHAAATTIEVSLHRAGETLIVSVEDDGQGFEPSSVDESLRFGLGLMRTRVELVGGFVEVNSQMDEGTMVTITLPATADISGTQAVG